MAQTTPQQRSSKCKELVSFSKKLNLFDDGTALSPIDQLLATRIFLLSIVTTLTVLVAFTAFAAQTHTTTVRSPTEALFKQLSARYPRTLSCPCTQASIRYDEFLSFNPQYHSVCSRQLVNQSFITSLSDGNMSDYYPLDYRLMSASHFQSLALFCRTSQQLISDTLRQSASEHLIATRVLSYDDFDAQAQAITEQLQSTAIADMKRTSNFVWLNIHQNSIFSALRSNYYVQIDPASNTTVFFAMFYKSANSTCSCVTDRMCVHQAGFYHWTGRQGMKNLTHIFGDVNNDPSLLMTAPGLMIGCLAHSSILQSTLECFYNQSCIDQIQAFVNEFSSVSPLPSLSRFAQQTTVSELFDQLFSELWNEKKSFTGYFQACSANLCTYSYVRRFDLLYVIVTIIGLAGGLKTIMYFAAPRIVEILRRIQRISCCDKTTDATSIEIQADTNQSEFFICRTNETLQDFFANTKRLPVIENNRWVNKVNDRLTDSRRKIWFFKICTVALSLSFLRLMCRFERSIHFDYRLNLSTIT